MSSRRQHGFTLIEIVIAIVVISIAAITLIGLLAFTSRTSAEGMTLTQSTEIANAYLQEILRQEFSGVDDDISGYDGAMHAGARDGSGQLVAGLENYRVSISVQTPNLGPAGSDVPGADTRLVTVTVTDPLGDTVRLSGFRTRRP